MNYFYSEVFGHIDDVVGQTFPKAYFYESSQWEKVCVGSWGQSMMVWHGVGWVV